MKTIILRIEIPNDAEIIGVNVQYSNGFTDDAMFTEIHLPTDGEKRKALKDLYGTDEVTDYEPYFKRGIDWYESKIMQP